MKERCIAPLAASDLSFFECLQGFDVVFYGDGLVEMLRGTTMGGCVHITSPRQFPCSTHGSPMPML